MKKFWQYAIIIFQIGLLVSLVKGLQLSIKSRERVTTLEEKKSVLEQENKELSERYLYVQSPEYLEEVARDELHLTKPGEKIVIVPEDGLVPEVENQKEKQGEELKNWEKWLAVIKGE